MQGGGLVMGTYKHLDILADQIQEMLDEGKSRNAIATELKIHHVQVDRIIKRNNLEIYCAFDESVVVEPRLFSEAYTNQIAEDLLDEIFTIAFEDGYVELPTKDSEDYANIKKMLLATEVDIFQYAESLGVGKLTGYLHKRCAACQRVLSLKNYNRRPESPLGVMARCKRCYYEGRDREVLFRNSRIGVHRRRSISAELPTNWNVNIRKEAFAPFKGRCPLTDSSIDVHDDHFIPIKTGHGGTSLGNMNPLLSSLNMSKSDANPFEWFEANRQRFELDQSRFDSLVAKLAEQNGLTPEEFREYTDWCFANPRSLTQIKRDNARYGYRVTSVELWREATGRLRVESVS